MRRIREITTAGTSVIIREYDLPTVSRRLGEPRRPKENISPLSKVRANYREAWRKLTGLLNSTCRPGDRHIVLTHNNETRPTDPLKAKKILCKNTIPAFRKLYEARGIPFWYFFKIEVGKKGGIHYHLILPAFSEDWRFREVWPRTVGGIKNTPLDGDGEYSALAAYLLKSDNPDDPIHYNPIPGRKWSMSKTVKRPAPPKKKELSGSWEKKDPYIPKGYILRPDSYYIGENPYTHRLYRCYIAFVPPPAAARSAEEHRQKGD